MESRTAPTNGRKSSGKAKLKTLSERELHHLLVRTVKELGYDMSVFHLRFVDFNENLNGNQHSESFEIWVYSMYPMHSIVAIYRSSSRMLNTEFVKN